MDRQDRLRHARALLNEIQSRLDKAEHTNSTVADLMATLQLVIESLEDSDEQLQQYYNRSLVHQNLLEERLLAVEKNRLFQFWNRLVSMLPRPLYHLIHDRSPGVRQSAKSYAQWVSHEQAQLPSFDEHRAVSQHWRYTPVISLVTPLFRPREDWLADTVRSVRQQSYNNWELCIAIDGEPPSSLWKLLEEWSQDDSRIRWVAVSARSGISKTSNAAAALSGGEYIGLLGQDATLSPFGLHYIVEALQDGRAADLLYSDEDRLDAANRRVQPVFKPDWSPDLLTSCMYLGHLLVVKSDLFAKSNGFRSEYDGAHDYDFALRITEKPIAVRHVARMLYCRRTSGDSMSISKRDAEQAGHRAVEDAMRRRSGPRARVTAGKSAHTYVVQRPLPDNAAVTVIICSETCRLVERAIESVRRTAGDVKCEFIVVHHLDQRRDPQMSLKLDTLATKVIRYGGPFNYSLMNNAAAREATTPHLLFLNDDVFARSRGWCERLVAELQRPEIGIAGATLRYPEGSLQHAGIVLGLGDGAGHAGRFQVKSEFWPWLTLTRNVSAVTGACLAVRADVFQRLGGFDIRFPNNYNDVDLCLRAQAAGYQVICLSEEDLVHEECATRNGFTTLFEREVLYQLWAGKLRQCDPFYSRVLSKTEHISINLSGRSSLFAPGCRDDRMGRQ
jgi:GT2 family glycosyltransferase